MTWRWTVEDRVAFQRLRLALATVIDSQVKGHVTKFETDALAKARRHAQRAAFPTHAEAEVAALRQWLALIDSFLDCETDLRRLHIGALREMLGDVARILGPLADPMLDHQVRSEERHVRFPYRDD